MCIFHYEEFSSYTFPFRRVLSEQMGVHQSLMSLFKSDKIKYRLRSLPAISLFSLREKLADAAILRLWSTIYLASFLTNRRASDAIQHNRPLLKNSKVIESLLIQDDSGSD